MMESLCRKSIFLLVCSLMLQITACKDDEPAPTGRKLALTLLTEGLSTTAEVFVTDPEGNQLESELVNGQRTFFNTNESAPYYHLTIIDLISANTYAIKTYQQIPSSSYFIKKPAASTVAGLHRISFPNVANYQNFNMQSEHLNAILPVSETEFDLQMTQAKSNLFLTVEKDVSGIPSYLVVEQAEVGKTSLLDEVTMNKFTAMTSKPVTATKDNYAYKIYGNIGDSKQLLVSSHDAAEPAPVSLYYPASTSLFTNYTTQVNFNVLKGNYIATISQVQTTPLPNEPTDQLDINLTSYQEATGKLEFVLAGSGAEWTHAQLKATQGDKSIYWDFYLPFSEQNTIQIPYFLITYLVEKQFTLVTNLKFSLIECSNDASAFNYEDFLRLELKRDGTPYFIKNRFTTGYSLPQ